MNWIIILLAVACADLDKQMSDDLLKLDQKYVRAKLKILKAYKAKYDHALKETTKKGDLDLALKYRDQANAIQARIDKGEFTSPLPDQKPKPKPALKLLEPRSLKPHPSQGKLIAGRNGVQYTSFGKISYAWTPKTYTAPLRIRCQFLVKAQTMRVTHGDFSFMCNRTEFKLYSSKDEKTIKGVTPQNRPVVLEWLIEKNKQTVWLDGVQLYTVPWRSSTVRPYKVGFGTGPHNKVLIQRIQVEESP